MLALSMDRDGILVDVYEIVEMKWKLVCTQSVPFRKLNGDLNASIRVLQRSRESLETWILLYGPPGTGKSSLTAAMNNHLKFDIYDLDLTDVQTNSDPRFCCLACLADPYYPLRISIALSSWKIENRRMNRGEIKVTIRLYKYRTCSADKNK
ncbi:hypothetical protein CRYUN_Cryun31cG0118200 [Craigia yunnanensis]